jgi:hypothetical protein
MSATERLPSLDDLFSAGAIDIRVWAVEWSPPLGARAPGPDHRPVKWKCCIVPRNPARPIFVTIRNSAAEADRDCRLAFYRHYSKNPSRFPPPERPPDFPQVEPDADDDDGLDMI